MLGPRKRRTSWHITGVSCQRGRGWYGGWRARVCCYIFTTHSRFSSFQKVCPYTYGYVDQHFVGPLTGVTVLPILAMGDSGLRVSGHTPDSCALQGRSLSSHSVGLSSHQAKLGYVVRSPGGYLSRTPFLPAAKREREPLARLSSRSSSCRTLTRYARSPLLERMSPWAPIPASQCSLVEVTSSPLPHAAHPGEPSFLDADAQAPLTGELALGRLVHRAGRVLTRSPSVGAVRADSPLHTYAVHSSPCGRKYFGPGWQGHASRIYG